MNNNKSYLDASASALNWRASSISHPINPSLYDAYYNEIEDQGYMFVPTRYTSSGEWCLFSSKVELESQWEFNFNS